MSQTGHGPGEERLDPDDGYDDRHEDDYENGEYLEEPVDEPKPRRSRFRGCLPVLIVLAVLLGGAWFGGRWAFDEISTRLAPAPDYEGPGSGTVLYQVKSGKTSTEIGRELKAADVVKSVDAFTEAARNNDESRNIQVGYYKLKKKMKASQALGVLVDPDNLMQSLVVVPEGARVRQIVKTIVDKSDISRKAVIAALADPKAIGLPPEAENNPEGFLFPATYTVPPKETALGLIRQMVAKSVEVQESLDVASRAQKVGLTPAQVLTVASLLEYEVNRSEDYPKVARVIYNRLDKGMNLELDSTVSYVSQREGDVWTTAEERANPSRYNTYAHPGLPPGPIGSPGEETIEAALEPADGDWLFFVADIEDKTTRFSESLSDHNKWVRKLQDYCRRTEDC